MRKVMLLTAAVAFIAVVTASAAPKSTGTVKLKGAGLALELTFANKQKLVITSKGTSMPEGTYAPESFVLLKQGRDGAVWKLEGTKNLGDLAALQVTKGQTTELDLGPPLQVKAVRYMSAQNKAGDLIIPIGYSISGKNGEFYAPAVYVGARKTPAPYFQITDGNDKVLAEGQFEYG